MNVVNALPAFMRPVETKEPIAPRLPPAVRPEDRRQMTLDFMDSVDRDREENAYLRSEVEQLRVELKVAREEVRNLDRELNFVRDDRDRLLQHDTAIMTSLENIEALIVAAKAKARAEAYAPPASGTQQQPEETEQDRQITAGLAERLAPEGGNAQS